MLRRILIASCLIGIITSCKEKKQSNSWSIIHGDTLNTKFEQPEEFIRRGSFEEANNHYQSVLKEKLNPIEIEYARLSEALSYLLTSDSATLNTDFRQLDNQKLSGLFHLVQGINLFHLKNSGLEELNLAKIEFKHNGFNSTIQYLITLDQIGLYHRTVDSRIDSALYYYKEALQLVRSENKLSFYESGLLYNLAELSLMFRDTYTGLAYVQQALKTDIAEEVKGKILTIKGTMFRKLENYDSAEKYYTKAQTLLLQPGREASLSELMREQALKAILMRDKESFERMMYKLNLIDSVKRGPHVNLDRLYGYYYFTFKEPLKSIQHYESAVKVLSRQKQLDVVQIGEAYYHLTEQYRRLKKFDQAELNCYRIIVNPTALRNSSYNWKNVIRSSSSKYSNNFFDYLAMADIYLDHFDYNHNELYLQHALSLYTFIDSAMANDVRVNEDEAKAEYALISHRSCSGGIRASYHLYKNTHDTFYLNSAHQFLEKSKALLIYKDMLTRQKDYFPGVPEEFKSRELEIKEKITRLKSGTQGLSTPQLTTAINELDQYFQGMKSRYPDYFSMKNQLSIPSFQYFQRLSIANHQTFVQYHLTENYIYFITYDRPSQFERIAIDSTFEKRFNRFMQLISNPPDIAKKRNQDIFFSESNYFYRQLIEPLHLTSPNLLIASDGILSRLPFEVLVTDTLGKYATASYLVKKISIVYAHSLKNYNLKQNFKIHKLKSVLAYAYTSPNEDDKTSSYQLPELPGSFRELQAIESVFKDGDLTLKYGSEATRKQFLRDIRKPFDIIHIALHSSTSNTNKFDNKILFKGGNSKPEALYGFELASHKLAANLVMLTGCETSRGPWVTGEGTYSLTRAFEQTGSRNIVASLWSVADQNSTEIISEFYQNLQRGKSINNSLREAKLIYLAKADNFTAHPFFWASLVFF